MSSFVLSSLLVIHIHTNTHSHTFIAPLCCLQLFIGGMVSSFVLLFSYTHTYKYTLTHTFSRAPVLLAAVHRRNGVFFRPLLLFSYTHTYKYTHTHIFSRPCTACSCSSAEWCLLSSSFSVIHIHTNTHSHISRAPVLLAAVHRRNGVFFRPPFQLYTYIQIHTHTHLSRPCAACSCSSAEWCLLSSSSASLS